MYDYFVSYELHKEFFKWEFDKIFGFLYDYDFGFSWI